MRSSLRKWLLVPVVLLCGCFSLELPSPPGVGAPGLVSGRVVWQRPGRLQAEPARGASVFVLGTNLAAESDSDGRFLVEGLISGEGSLLIRFDGDGDGQPERQRSFQLKDIGAGRGRQISLGDVTLGQSAAVAGRVLLGDVTDANGHLGTPVFVPGFPLAAITQADGTFVLEGLAEGSVQLAAVRSGYQAYLSGPLALRGGEELGLARVSLARETQTPSGVLQGKVVGADGQPLPGVSVTTSGAHSATTDGAGSWRLSGLPVDRYDVLFSLPGRLPAALYNVLVAGPDEVTTPDVVLIEGQAAASTPSLVNEVAQERDAGSGAGPDGGIDGGTDAGTDAGTDGGYAVSISFAGTAPLTLIFPGPSVGLNATVVPTPQSAATYAWSVRGASVMLGNPSQPQTGLTPVSPGSFVLDLSVIIAGETYYAPAVAGMVVPANADAGMSTLFVSDAGATALSLWLEVEGPVNTPISGTIQSGPTAIPATFAWNDLTRRLVALFDSPQPNAMLDLSIPSLQLADGGVRSVTRRVSTPALAFGPSVLLLDGGLTDFNAGATYTPDGVVAVGRYDNGTNCTGCFVAISPRGQEALGTSSSTPAVPWRRATSAGFTVQAWFSTTLSYERDQPGPGWAVKSPPPGPVYVEGPALKAVGSMSGSVELWTLASGTWTSPEQFGSFTGGLGLHRSSVVTLPNGPSSALIIADDGTVQVWTKPVAGSWQNLGASFPSVPTGVTGGRIAATNAGLVMFLVDGSGTTVLRSPPPYAMWIQVPFTSTPLDVVGRGGTAYLAAALTTTQRLEVVALNPGTGVVQTVGVPTTGTVRSAELAVGDFGELGVAWSEGAGTSFDLLLSEIK